MKISERRNHHRRGPWKTQNARKRVQNKNKMHENGYRSGHGPISLTDPCKAHSLAGPSAEGAPPAPPVSRMARPRPPPNTIYFNSFFFVSWGPFHESTHNNINSEHASRFPFRASSFAPRMPSSHARHHSSLESESPVSSLLLASFSGSSFTDYNQRNRLIAGSSQMKLELTAVRSFTCSGFDFLECVGGWVEWE